MVSPSIDKIFLSDASYGYLNLTVVWVGLPACVVSVLKALDVLRVFTL